jgi:hypothetical protein
MGMSGVESGYMALLGPGPATFTEPTIAAGQVASEALFALEGPVWQSVRGTWPRCKWWQKRR